MKPALIMDKFCCVNKLIFNTITGVPPDIDPPVNPTSDVYIYEIIINTTGFGGANGITGVTIDGVLYPNDGLNGIGGPITSPASCSFSLYNAGHLSGSLTVAPDYSIPGGSFSGLDHNPTGYVYMGLVLDSQHTVSITYDTNLGQPHVTTQLIQRSFNLPHNLSGSQAAGPAATVLAYLNISAPLNTGGTASMGIPSSFSVPMNDGAILGFEYDTIANVFNMGSGSGNPFEQVITITDNGGSYDIRITNAFLPYVSIETDQGVIILS